MAESALHVKGLADLHRALGKADKQQRLGIRKAERQVAEPVKVEAQALATREISRIGTKWWTMRIGITQKLVYVAPKMRRTTGSRRPKFANVLRTKSLEPAAERNREKVRAAFQDVIDNMASNFNRGV